MLESLVNIGNQFGAYCNDFPKQSSDKFIYTTMVINVIICFSDIYLPSSRVGVHALAEEMKFLVNYWEALILCEQRLLFRFFL